MKIKKIKPMSKIDAAVQIPGSKSITNRALLIASLAKGKSIIKNPLFSDDTNYMINALKQLGVKIIKKKNNLTVYGTNGEFRISKKQLYVGNAGTAMRFLVGLAVLIKGKTTITGNKRMQQRPIKDLLSALQQLGIKSSSNKGCPPVTIYGGTIKKSAIKIDGSVSSQFISSLLMIGQYLDNTINIKIKNKLTSRTYIDITLEVMKRFGASIQNKKYKEFIIINKRYRARTFAVEPDLSNSSYFFAAAAITNGKITIKNISINSKQGDIKFIDVLKNMGCEVKWRKNDVELTGNELKGIDIDMNDMPDTVQTLAVVALFAKGKTIIRNIRNLRYKETDRIKALAAELRKLGAEVKERADAIEITAKKLKPATIETYDDHRMAMSFAVAGLKIPGIQIKNPDCVKKSFPDFWKTFDRLYVKNNHH